MPSEGRSRLRTIKTRLKKSDFEELAEELTVLHWNNCCTGKGCMICDCRRVQQLRELYKLAE